MSMSKLPVLKYIYDNCEAALPRFPFEALANGESVERAEGVAMLELSAFCCGWVAASPCGTSGMST